MYKTITIILLLLAIIISCNDNNGLDYTIGDDFIKSETTIAIVDTFEVDLSTFMVDSMVSSNTSVGLIGNYIDNEFGTIHAKCYCQVTKSEESYTVDTEDKFDSLTIKMRYSGVVFGDTTKLQKINVYRLTQELATRDDGNLYNNSSFAHETDPIGSISLKPRPVRDVDLEIRLSDVWGQELLNMMRDNTDEMSTSDKFIQYLPGFVIESETNDGAILSMTLADSTFYMTVYAHRFDVELTESEFVFPYTNSDLQFNQITSDRTGTNSALLTNNNRNDISSTLTGNHSFVQGGLGIFTRLEFPGVPHVLEMDQKRMLLKAELVIKPVYKSYSVFPLPEKLYLYESNRVNEVLSALTNSDDEVISAEAVIDDIYFKDTYYSFDITEFISTELADGFYDTEHALLINIPTEDVENKLDRIVIADRSQARYRPTLKLYYVFYN